MFSRRLTSMSLSVAVLGGSLLAGPALLLAAPALPFVAERAEAAATVRISFNAGCHTGHRFNAAGAVTATKYFCLHGASGAAATGRQWINTRGVYFPITNGVWAGYLIPETPNSYVAGFVALQNFPSPVARVFPTGVYVGYAFDPTWAAPTSWLTSMWVNTTTSYLVSRHAVINGRYFYLLSNSSMAGMWVKAAAYHTFGPRMHYGPNPPACAYRDVLTARRGYADWNDSLLDPIYRLSSSYAPGDLVSTSSAGLNGGYSIRRVVASDLRAVVAAARAAGAPIHTLSAYRSYASQVATFNSWVARSGYQAALLGSARPGHSEHQLGTTLDFKSAGGASPISMNDWATTPAGTWMRDNAWRYGFLMTYPKSSTAKTCYQYEPWHYRYVGRPMAAEVHSSGLTLREWIWRRFGR